MGCLSGRSKLALWLKSRFYLTLYSNIVQSFLSAQLMLCFCCCAATLDRSFDSTYKAINFAVCISGVFVFGMATAMHPVMLFVLKRNRQHRTDDCYFGVLRSGQRG